MMYSCDVIFFKKFLGQSQKRNDGDAVNIEDEDDDSESSSENEETAIDQEVSKVMKDIGKNEDEQDVALEDEIRLIEEYRALLTAARH